MNIFNQDISIAISFLIINIIVITYTSFKNGVPTCSNYVMNVYLYLALFIIIFYLFTRLHNNILFNKEKQNRLLKKEEFKKPNKYMFYYAILLVILLLFIVFNPYILPLFFDPKKYPSSFIISSFLYITFVFLLSGMSIMYFKSEQYAKYITEALGLVFIIFITMSYVVYTFPLFFENSYSYVVPGLLVALLASIIFSIINYFTAKSKESLINTAKIIAYFGIVIFSIFISYDTSRVFQNEKLCNMKRIPNYPKESFDFFLDVINIFQKILFIRGNE